MVSVRKSDTNSRISVKSTKETNAFAIKDNLSEYYAKQAENWAHSDVMVNGIDYSSKYYAEQSKASAQVADEAKTATQELIESFDNNVQIAKDDIEQNRIDSINAIDNTYGVAIGDIQEKSDEVLTSIETLRVEAVDNITTVKNDLVNEINTTGKSYDNLTHKQITNCITEIPQRIKYDIADGVITIKAGTIIIVPYGTEDLTSNFPVGSVFLNNKFKVVDRQFSDGKFFVWVELQSNLSGSGTGTQIIETSVIVNITGGSLTGLATSLTTSSSSQASETSNTNYRTDLNVVQFIRNSALNSNIGSFPLLITKSDGVNIFASVSQVFNGMGYIGSTVWVDKGVKMLIADGRNEDGTINNFEYETQSVIVSSNTNVSDGSIPFFRITPTLGKPQIYTIRKKLFLGEIDYVPPVGSTFQWYFNTTEMKWYMHEDGETKWVTTPYLNLTNPVNVSNGNITSFQPKQPFRAVDYNGYRTEVDSKVSKAGDTMTGNLTIDKASQAIFTLDSQLAGLGSSPSGGANTGSIYFKQKGVLTAIIQNIAAADGGNRLQLITRKPDNSAWGAGCNLITSKTGVSTFDFPKCTTKATTTSTASGGSVAVIVQNYKNGRSWYRVWSDGWIEQGGYGLGGVYNSAKSFSLLKNFSDTNYNVQLTCYGATGHAVDSAYVHTKTTSSFSVVTGFNAVAGQNNVDWYACGY